MILLNLSEWIANLFILGLTVVIWLIAIFLICILISLFEQWMKEILNNRRGK